MKSNLNTRLNQILPKITSPSFLASQGIGNEIACYIFDYSAQHELEVREHLQVIDKHLAAQHSQLMVVHLNLLEVVLAYLSRRGLLEKTLKLEESKGSAATLKALSGPVSAEKLCDFIDREYEPAKKDLILISGVGSAWPLVRAHSLLNGLHPVVDHTPLVLFYPGTFDGTTLRLFGEIATASKPGAKNYYRAFKLIPQGDIK